MDRAEIILLLCVLAAGYGAYATWPHPANLHPTAEQLERWHAALPPECDPNWVNELTAGTMDVYFKRCEP